MMIKVRRQKKGFSLPEVMVGVAVLASVVVASTSLLVTTMRTNQSNAQRLQAFYLAEEGIEAIRNIRDSNWLQGIDWRADTDDGRGLWGTDLKAGIYAVALKGIDNAQTFSVLKNAKTDSVAGLKQYTPWSISKVDTNVCPQKVEGGVNLAECKSTILYQHQMKEVGVFYNHQPQLVSAESEASNFRRWIEISDVKPEEGAEANDLRMRVKSVVVWSDSTGEKKVELDSEFTDWKSGPL